MTTHGKASTAERSAAPAPFWTTALASAPIKLRTEVRERGGLYWQAGIKLADTTVLSDWRPSPALAVTSLQTGVNDHGRATGLAPEEAA